MKNRSHARFVFDIGTLQYCFLTISLWYYSYLYFFPFNEGVSGAPVVFNYLKYLIWGMLVFCTIAYVHIDLKHLLIVESIVVFSWLLLIQLVHLPQYESYLDPSGIFLGNMFIFVPAVGLFSRDAAAKIFRALPYIMAVQVLLSFIADEAHRDLWENHAYVGAVGTHVAFGLMLNLSIASVLSKHQKLSVLDLAVLLVLFFGLLYSKSLSALAVCFLIIGIYLFTTIKRYYFYYSALLVIGLFSLKIAWDNKIISNYVIASAVKASRNVTGDPELFANLNIVIPHGLSGSVGVRQDIYRKGWEFLNDNGGFDLLFGSFTNSAFMPFDSQYLVVLVNYGLLSLVLFLCLVGRIGSMGYGIYRRNGDLFPLFSAIIFGLSFFFSRHLYYFPENILFYMLIVYIAKYEHINRTVSA